jgi:hypothetical protein
MGSDHISIGFNAQYSLIRISSFLKMVKCNSIVGRNLEEVEGKNELAAQPSSPTNSSTAKMNAIPVQKREPKRRTIQKLFPSRETSYFPVNFLIRNCSVLEIDLEFIPIQRASP